jgi:cytochrome c peroxidase
MKHKVCLLTILTIALCGCLADSATSVNDQGASYSAFKWNLPSRIPLPVEPADNPMTEAKFQLGRHLFYDKRLSTNGTISCSSCHHQDKAFADGVGRPHGATNEQHPRNSQGLTNVAWYPVLTWGNPVLGTIEQQIMLPLFGEDPIEHGINDTNQGHILTELRADATYQALFDAAFPETPDAFNGDNTWHHIVQALASFVRGLTSYDSARDRYIAGDKTAMSDAARRGDLLFNNERLECFHCHEGYNLTNSTRDRTMTVLEIPFHNTGLYNVDGLGSYPANNQGIFEITGKINDTGAFRAPSLRNVALTAPYMHDGSIATLEEVIRTYAAGGRNITQGDNIGDGRQNPFKDSFISGFSISDDEVQDVIAFLESLTDNSFTTNPRFSNPWEAP